MSLIIPSKIKGEKPKTVKIYKPKAIEPIKPPEEEKPSFWRKLGGILKPSVGLYPAGLYPAEGALATGLAKLLGAKEKEITPPPPETKPAIPPPPPETWWEKQKRELGAVKEAAIVKPTIPAYISAISERFIPTKLYSAFDKRFKLDEKIEAFEEKLEKEILKIRRKLKIPTPTDEQVAKMKSTALENIAKEEKEIAELKKEFPVIDMAGGFVGDIANIVTFARVFAPLTPLVAGKVALTTKVFHPVATRIISYIPSAGATFGTIHFLQEAADQIEARKFSPTKMIGETLKGVGWGAALSIAHAFPTAPVRIGLAGLMGSGWTTLETLIVNKQITKEDIPAIATSGALIAAFEFINSKAVTRAYKDQVISNQSRYIFENRIKITDPAVRKSTADLINKLDVMATIQRGTPDGKLAESARNKLMATTMYEKDIQYIVVDKNLKPIKTETRSLSDFLTPQEKFLIQHINSVVGEPAPISFKLLEPNPIVQEQMIKAPDIVTQIDAFIRPTLLEARLPPPPVVYAPPAPGAPVAPVPPEVIPKPKIPAKPLPEAFKEIVVPTKEKAIIPAKPPTAQPPAIKPPEVKPPEIKPEVAPEVKPIAEELKPLAEVAREYKTPEEFRAVIHEAVESKDRTPEQQKLVDLITRINSSPETIYPKPAIENFWKAAGVEKLPEAKPAEPEEADITEEVKELLEVEPAPEERPTPEIKPALPEEITVEALTGAGVEKAIASQFIREAKEFDTYEDFAKKSGIMTYLPDYDHRMINESFGSTRRLWEAIRRPPEAPEAPEAEEVLEEVPELTTKGRKALGIEKPEPEAKELMAKLEEAVKPKMYESLKEAREKMKGEGAISIYEQPLTQEGYVVYKILNGEPIPAELNYLAVKMWEQGMMEEVEPGKGTPIDMTGMFYLTAEEAEKSQIHHYRFDPEFMDKETIGEQFPDFDKYGDIKDWEKLQSGWGVQTSLEKGDIVKSMEIPATKVITKGKNKGKVVKIPGLGTVEDIFDNGAALTTTEKGIQQIDAYSLGDAIKYEELTTDEKTIVDGLKEVRLKPIEGVLKPEVKPPKEGFIPELNMVLSDAAGYRWQITDIEKEGWGLTFGYKIKNLDTGEIRTIPGSEIRESFTPIISKEAKEFSAEVEAARLRAKAKLEAAKKEGKIAPALDLQVGDRVEVYNEAGKFLRTGEVLERGKDFVIVKDDVTGLPIKHNFNFEFRKIKAEKPEPIPKEVFEIRKMNETAKNLLEHAKKKFGPEFDPEETVKTAGRISILNEHSKIEIDDMAEALSYKGSLRNWLKELYEERLPEITTAEEFERQVTKSEYLDRGAEVFTAPQLKEVLTPLAREYLIRYKTATVSQIKKMQEVYVNKTLRALKEGVPELKPEELVAEPKPAEKPEEYITEEIELTTKGRRMMGKPARPKVAKGKVVPEEKMKETLFRDFFQPITKEERRLPVLGRIAVVGNKFMATDLEKALVYTADKDTGVKATIHIKEFQLPETKRWLKPEEITNEMVSRVGESIQDFPLLPEVKKPKVATSFSLPPEVLKKALSSVTKEGYRPELTAILFKTAPEGLVLASTDSFRLWQNVLPGKPLKEFSFMLPGNSAKLLAKILDKVRPEDINIKTDDVQIEIEFGKFKFLSRLIEGEYPDYKPIIPDKPMPISFGVNRLEFLDIIQEAKAYVPPTNEIQLLPDKGKGILKIKTERTVNDKKEVFEREIPAEIKEKVSPPAKEKDLYIVMPIKNGENTFNRNFLEDFLKNAQADKINGLLGELQNPAVFLETAEPAGVKFVKDLGKAIYTPEIRDKEAEYIKKTVAEAYGKPYLKRSASFVTLQLKEKGYFYARDQKVEGPDDVADMFRELKNSDREKFFVVNLDKNNKIINIENLFTGTINASLVHPEGVIKSITLSKAKKVYLIHNHPSGEVEPSEDDLLITRRIENVIKGMGVEPQGHIIMNTVDYGYMYPTAISSKDMKAWEKKPLPPEAKERIKIKMVEVEQRIKNLPEKLNKTVSNDLEVADIASLILNDEVPAILAVNLSARNKINGVNVVTLSIRNPEKIANKIIKNAALNNAVSVILTTNLVLDETVAGRKNVASFQAIADKLGEKGAGIELLDIVGTKPQVSLKRRGELGIERAEPKIKGKPKFYRLLGEKGAEYEALTSEEREVIDVLEKGEKIPKRLIGAVKKLKGRGYFKTKGEEEKPGKKFVKYLGKGFATPEQVEVIQKVIETKKIPPHISAQLRNSFTGRKRTKVEELTEPQADQLREELLQLTPSRFGKIKLVDEETLRAMADFIPPSLSSRKAITTGNVLVNLREPDIGYILPKLRQIRKVLEGTPMREKIYDKVSSAEEKMEREERAFLKELRELTKSAKKSEKDAEIKAFQYIEGEAKPEIAPPEITSQTRKLAEFLKKFFFDTLPIMKPLQIRKGYITHTKPSFTERIEKVGLQQALKEIINPIRKEEIIPPDILANLEFIIANEKFNPFALPREGGPYSKRIMKSAGAYARVYFFKKNFDPVLPEINKMRKFLPPNLRRWVGDYIKTVKGRPIDFRWGRRAHSISNFLVRLEYMRLLGLNFGSGVVNIIGGTLNNFADMPLEAFLKGHRRLFTRQGRQIIRDYGFAQQAIMTEPVGGVWENLTKAERSLFIIMQGGEFILRGSNALGRIPKSEFMSGKLSEETLSKTRRGIGRTQGLYGKAQSPLAAQTAIGRPAYQFKQWMLTEMELYADWCKEAIEYYKRNPKQLNAQIRNPGLVKWVKYLLLAIPLFLFGGQKIRKEIVAYRWLPVALWRTATNPQEWPVGRDLYKTSSALIKIVQGNLEGARREFTKPLQYFPPAGIQVQRTADFIKALQTGATYSPTGKMRERVSVGEAFKRLLMGTQTTQAQKYREYQEELSKLMPWEYTTWDEYVGESRRKSDYLKMKEKTMDYIKDKKYKTWAEVKKDQKLYQTIANYNKEAQKRFNELVVKAGLSKIMTKKQYQSNLKQITISYEDIERWFETEKKQKEATSLERRLRME